VLDALTGKHIDRSEIGFIIAECKELSQLLVDWKVAKVKRG
jgi:hypothetical protein